MILKCLASGSSGNCYVLKDSSGKMLLLDAGIPIMKIKEGCDWNVSDIVACLVTHKHMDHAKAVDDLEDMGITVFKPYAGESAKNIDSDFTAMGFPLNDSNGHFKHTDADGTECPCYGYIISHPEMGKMLYITDTEFVRWRFEDANHILVSCNYQNKYLADDVSGKWSHVIRGHMELETCVAFIKANVSETLRNVIICHLSSNNAVAEEMIEEISKVAGNANVDFARAGVEWELSKEDKCPFL